MGLLVNACLILFAIYQIADAVSDMRSDVESIAKSLAKLAEIESERRMEGE